MSYMGNAVAKIASKKQAVACGVCAAALALSCAAVPAFAAQSNTGNDANSDTKVYLTMDTNAQLSVTAPTHIDYTLEGTGDFTCPDASAVQFTNNSVVPVAVKSYTVADQTSGKATAVTKDTFGTTQAKNAWWNQATAKAGDKATASAAVELNQATATLPAAWNMGTAQSDYNGTQSNVISLTTSGAMKNLDGQIDFNTQTELAQVTWTFGTVMNQ